MQAYLSKLHQFSRYCSAIIALICCCAYKVHAGNIPVVFAGGNNFPGNMFDIVTLGKPLQITGFDINVGKQNSVVHFSVYHRVGSYAGFEKDPTAWVLVGTVQTVSQGIGNRTFVDVPDFQLAPHTLQSIYITQTAAAFSPHVSYFRTGSKTYSNTDLQTHAGIGLGNPSGLSKRNRTWTGTVYYEAITAVPVPSGALLAGMGVLCLLVRVRFKKHVCKLEVAKTAPATV
jgi:hypothetical protein